VPTSVLRLTALSWALCVLAACGRTPQAPGERKQSAGLKATPEVVALLQDRQQRCAAIGKSASERLREAQSLRQPESAPAAAAAPDSAPDKDPAQVLEELLKAASSPAKERETERERDASRELEEMLKRYLANDARPELAAADRTRQLVDGLLPNAAAEVSPEAAQAVAALAAAQDTVCQVARTYRSPVQYERLFDDAVRGYEAAEARLQSLVEISAADLRFARYKYLPQVEKARDATADRLRSRLVLSPEEYARERREWEASQELMAQQQDEHEDAVRQWRARGEKEESPGGKVLVSWFDTPAEKRVEIMRSWYGGYTAEAAPVRRALASYTSLRLQKGAKLRSACRELLSTTSALLTHPAALKPPDPAAHRILTAAYGELQQSAQACTKGLDAEAAFRLGFYHQAMGRAAETLRAYSLQP
jgi:hypothetical protein